MFIGVVLIMENSKVKNISRMLSLSVLKTGLNYI